MADFIPPEFNYTGKLRPHYVTPMRSVPLNILKTDYYLSGYPASEMEQKRQNKIPILNTFEIELLREACRRGRKVLDAAGNAVAVGITTEQIDLIVHEKCIELEVYPSPLNYHGFPKACCTSVNEIICHGIPDCRELQDGDIVNIDISVYYKGFHADLNETFLVGDVAQEHKNLVKNAYDCLMAAIAEVRPGMMFRDFGRTISKTAKDAGHSVVKTYCGHGIGTLFHCAPNVPHYAKNKAIGVVRPGIAFTIEPMINEGHWQDVTWPDDWTAATVDGKWSAQFEHTLLATETGVEILTARTEESVRFHWE